MGFFGIFGPFWCFFRPFWSFLVLIATRCGGDLLGFGLCRLIGLLIGTGSEGEWVSACRPGRAVGGSGLELV